MSNMSSASERPSVVDEFVATELVAGRILGPVEATHSSLHVNRFGLVPKGHCSRLIVDLSFPAGGSVNEGINPALCSLQYTSVDTACQNVLKLGQGAKLAKFDVSGAFRIVPVHPDDCHLLGMQWRDHIYMWIKCSLDQPPYCIMPLQMACCGDWRELIKRRASITWMIFLYLVH